MAKIMTEDIIAFQKKTAKKKPAKYSFWRDAWTRLKKTPTSVIGLVIIIIMILAAIFANVIAQYDPVTVDYMAMSQPPSAAHWFGTDNLGRDIFARCLFGARYSIPLGLGCCVISLAVGGLIGLLAAFFGGRADTLLMRFIDVLQSIPAVLMAILVVAMFGTGIPQLLVALAIGFIPEMAKTVRAAILTVRGNEFVEACSSIGAGNIRLMFRHIIPNAMGFILISTVNVISGGILMISMLSYISLGVQPPASEWGFMLSSAKSYISSAPHMVIFPGLMILLTVLSFNMFADGLRDALDPRLK